jgi:hypothetical protein
MSFQLDGSQVVPARLKAVSLQEIVLDTKAPIRGTSSPWHVALRVEFVYLPENTWKMLYEAVH